jgi:hypothetical protein
MNGLKKTFAIAAAVSLVCLSSAGAIAANKLIVKDSTGTTDKFVVTDSGFVGIGASPSFPLTIVGAGNFTQTTLYMVNNGRTATTGSADDSPGLYLVRANISTLNGGMPRSQDRLGFINFASRLSGATKISAYLASYATGTWTTTSTPSFISISTTNNGSISPTEKMRIKSLGATGIVQVNGGAMLNSTGTKPACSAALRGTLWLTQVAGGTASGDLLQICAQLPSSTSFNWRTVTLTP